MLIHEGKSENVKVGAWRAVSWAGIIEVFFFETVSLHIYFLPQGMHAEYLIILSVTVYVLH